MSESLSQGIPKLQLNDTIFELLKCNDISFRSLRKVGFKLESSNKKPDQLVVSGNQVLIAIEEKASSSDIEKAIKQIKDNYLDALPNTMYFIGRAGEIVKVFYRVSSNKIIEVGTTLKGEEVVCFGPKVITGENVDAINNLSLLTQQVAAGKEPVNGSIEIKPPKDFYNPLSVKQNTIYKLWQKIFVATGENAHICLATFVELLLYKGISDAGLLPSDYSIEMLADSSKTNSLDTYKNVVRNSIKTSVFPTISNQPGVINGFAFEEQETVFKTVLKDLMDLGNLARRQIDPDFKRRIIEAFLGSAHKEGTIKSGKHLTPRIIIQAIWEMAKPHEHHKIVDPACGVGGFVLEGINYPYEFNVLNYSCEGIDRDEQMIITAKANMILHMLDKFADPDIDNDKLSSIVNKTFYQAKNNGTGTLGELETVSKKESEFTVKHEADFVFSNVPFYVNGVSQLVESLEDIGLEKYYDKCGIGVESRFLKYILGQIENGQPGVAFVIVTDGILYRHKDNIRNVIKQKADVMGIISLPEGCFQNNNWKTSILIFQKKSKAEYSPVFLYNVENIGISLDAYRSPIEENDIPGLKKAWKQRASGKIDDPCCRLVSRDDFNAAERWIELFDYCRTDKSENNISVSEFVESADSVNDEISQIIESVDKDLSGIFSLENYEELKLGDTNYFKTSQANFKTTVKHARHNPGDYPLYSSQVNGPVEYMSDKNNKPILYSNEGEKMENREKLISWNIKGDPGKDIREHFEPFYATENRGLISVKSDSIDFYYLLYYLREHFISQGKFSRSNEAHVGKVKDMKVRFPVNEKGEIDLKKQRLIAGNYKKVLDLRRSVRDKIDDLNDLLENIDVFK